MKAGETEMIETGIEVIEEVEEKGVRDINKEIGMRGVEIEVGAEAGVEAGVEVPKEIEKI